MKPDTPAFKWTRGPELSANQESGSLVVTGKGSLQHILRIKHPRDLRIWLEEDVEAVCCTPQTDDEIRGEFAVIDAGRHEHSIWAIEIEWNVERQRVIQWTVAGDKV